METKGRESSFKCILCGKYISYQDIADNKVGYKYTPDTEYTTESNEFWHKKCKKKNK